MTADVAAPRDVDVLTGNEYANQPRLRGSGRSFDTC